MDSELASKAAFGETPTELLSKALMERILASQGQPQQRPESIPTFPIATDEASTLDSVPPVAFPPVHALAESHLSPLGQADVSSRSAGLPAAVLESIERFEQSDATPPINLSNLHAAMRAMQFGNEQARGIPLAERLMERASSTEGKSPSTHRLFVKLKETTGALQTAPRHLDTAKIRQDFPALHQSVHGHDLIWLDNAATTHKPAQVISALSQFYARDYSNIHRAAHSLAARATDHYEAARDCIRHFIHADESKDIVFVRGTTEGINLIANTCGAFLHEGDEILLTELEHHANIVPWQLVARHRRARIRVVPINDRGELMMDELQRLLSHRTKIVSVTHCSNTLGTILPVEEIGVLAKKHGAKFVVDGAQSIAHLPIDVKSLGCDFFVFSGHKVYAPTGIGAVYIHPELQNLLPPWQGGGNMIHRVTFDETTYAPPPNKFEAGTPSIGDAVGLRSALEYLRQFDPEAVLEHEHQLLEFARTEIAKVPGVHLIGNPSRRTGVVSFVIDGFTTERVGRELDRHGIAVRTGHHCAQPSLRHYGLEATIRPSFAIYNTHQEVETMVRVLRAMQLKR